MSYALYVGADLTDDGVGYLAGYGDEPSSHWLALTPRCRHPEGATLAVGVTGEAEMPGIRTHVPQVQETFRHLTVAYSHFRGVPPPLVNGGLNEHGVAVRDVWSPSHPRLVAMTPAVQRGPAYSDLARLVLDRCRTAREGVSLIGSMIAEHGESTYGGNSHLIADASEAWVVIEFAGGQGLWVAERLGRTGIRVSRPGYIGVVPQEVAGHDDFDGAEHLISFAVEQGWYRTSDGPFDVNEVYGDGRLRWRGVRWMEEELAARARRPQRLGFSDVAWAVRTERFTGDSAGYGQIVPLLAADERPELRVLWHAPVGPIAFPLTPYPLGITRVEPEYAQHRYLTRDESRLFLGDGDDPTRVSTVPQRVEATRSAVVAGKRLLYLLSEHFEQFQPEVAPVWEALEAAERRALDDAIEQARILISAERPDLASDLLTRFSSDLARGALEVVETMADSMEVRSRILHGIRDEPGWRGPEIDWEH